MTIPSFSASSTLIPSRFIYRNGANTMVDVDGLMTGGSNALEAQAGDNPGMCGCKVTDHGLQVMFSRCGAKFTPRCTFGNPHTLCDCVIRTCNKEECENGCLTASDCAGVPVDGINKNGQRCHFVKDCGPGTDTACCGVS